MSYPLEVLFDVYINPDKRKAISQAEFNTLKEWAKQDYKYGKISYAQYTSRLIEIENKYKVE